MKTTLLISTYNRPDALRLCLLSAFRQTLLPDEILVGDDGSTEETAHLIEEMKQRSPVPLIHVWQEDKGFRLAAVRNKCIARASGDYIVQVDGDLILQPHFIEDHLAFAAPGYYVKGGRVNITDRLTKALCASGELRNLTFFTPGLMRRVNAVHCLPLARYLSERRRTAPGLGCNLSYWRKDALAVNGYDEFFEGWGGEDWDFAVRLLHSGLKKRSLKFAGIVFHLWHNDLYMHNKAKNFKYYYEVVDNAQRVRCEHGVEQYLQEAQ